MKTKMGRKVECCVSKGRGVPVVFQQAVDLVRNAVLRDHVQAGVGKVISEVEVICGAFLGAEGAVLPYARLDTFHTGLQQSKKAAHHCVTTHRKATLIG